MEYSTIRASIIARERRRDLLHQVEQERLVQLAKADRASGVKAGPLAGTGKKVRMTWRRAVV